MSACVQLEAALAARCGRSHAVLTGRGAGAIAIALQVFQQVAPDRCAVILPATLCLSPPAVTRLAGLEPVFCDCEPQTGGMDPAALEALLEVRGDVLCVLAAHMFGEACRIEEIAALCRRVGVPLIEDAAQAWGADINGTPAGGFGDVSVISFGHTKILDAGGGGAALCDDPVLAEGLRDAATALPVKSANLAAYAKAYSERYYALAPVFDRDPDARLQVGALTLEHPERYAYRLDETGARAVLERLEETEAELAHRRALAEIYDAALDCGVRRIVRGRGGAPWRFGVLVQPERRDEVVAGLRAAGFHASTWYPCAASFFEPVQAGAFPGAEALQARIVNLWVDREVSAESARGAADLINEALAQSAFDVV